jgi:hypothetical protein
MQHITMYFYIISFYESRRWIFKIDLKFPCSFGLLCGYKDAALGLRKQPDRSSSDGPFKNILKLFDTKV